MLLNFGVCALVSVYGIDNSASNSLSLANTTAMLRIGCINFLSRNSAILRNYFVLNSSAARNKLACQRNAFSCLSLPPVLETVRHPPFNKTILIRTLSNEKSRKEKNRSTLMYICAMGIFMGGMAYAGVPLYRLFCQV